MLVRHRLFASVRNLLVEAYSISDVMADSVLEIAITQYTRNRFARNDDFPYVWAIALIGTPDDWVYLLNGTPPDATYLGPLRQTDITASGAYRGHIVLGTVNADQKSRIEEIIKSVTIYTDRTDWNCQNWVVLPRFGSVRVRDIFGRPGPEPGRIFLKFPDPQTEPLLTLGSGQKRFGSRFDPGSTR